MSKRVSLSENEIAALNSLLQEVLTNSYWSEESIADLEGEERLTAMLERRAFESLLKKIN